MEEGVNMFDDIENLKILSVLHKTSKPFGKVEHKKASAFNIRVLGAVKYTFEDKEIVVNEGEMIFLPKGSSYEYQKMCDEDSVVTIIYIEGDFRSIEPFVCCVKDFYDIDYIMHYMADMWTFGNQSQHFQCLSLLYGLLSYISNMDEIQYPDKTKFSMIEGAVSYLQKHIYDCDLQIDKLHLLSGISHTYFRKIFIDRFGKSPKNYIVSKRLSYAKSIIESGEFSTVKELAHMVGYKDPLYFGKSFKKHYGISPVKMTR